MAHAILCVVGFLAILPAGALFARYLRTVSPQWFKGHMTSQVFLGKSPANIYLVAMYSFCLLLAGPVIIAGVALGIEAVVKAGSKHLDDTHKVCFCLPVIFHSRIDHSLRNAD